MGYIKEPEGIDLTVENKPVSLEDRKTISAIIAYYKVTGRKMPFRKSRTKIKKQSLLRRKKDHSA